MQALPASSRDEKPVRINTGPTEVEIIKVNKNGLTRCQRIRYVIIIIVAIIIITIICTVFFDKNKKNKSKDNKEPKHEKDNSNEVMPKNNYFTGKCRGEKTNDCSPFNPEINYINKNDYSCEVLEDKFYQKNYLRDLESSDQKIFSFKITFHHPIDTMEKMFQNNNDLLEVDLSHLNTHNLKSLANTFSNCQNLETAKFANLDSSNVESMESTFEGCSKLTGLNLSSLNTSKVTSMKSMFKDCDSIIFLNLSNFNMNNVQDTSNMFYGCSNLKGLDLSSFNNIDNLFDPSSSLLSYLKIKINPNISNSLNIATDDNLDILCNSGEDEKCSECSSDKEKKYCCESCNDGYFLPRLEFPTYCKKCSIENCKKCINDLVCNECEDKLTFVNGKCVKACDDENCEKCRTEEDKIHQCEKCKVGYFLDEDEVNCLKCDVDNCKTCLNKKNQAVCDSCEENYYLFNELCFKSCSIGEEEKCLSCANDGTSDCLDCNDYYYLPVNSSNKEVCEKCNIEHCLKCSDSNENDTTICTKCEKGYIFSEDKCVISDTNNTNINNTNYISDINDISNINNISDISNISNINNESDINNISDNNFISDLNNISDNNSINDINNISEINTTSDINNISINIMSDTNNVNIISDISDINNISDFNNSNNVNKTICTIGSEEKCKTCNNNEDHLDQCETCNPGYYLPIDDEFKQECRRCDIENCKICNGTIDSNICYECNDDFKPNYEEDKINSCSSFDESFKCNPGYKLIDGKCEINYSFKATYYLESENENEDEKTNVKLLNIDEDKILEMTVDNNIEQPSNYFAFNSTGEHIVTVLLNLNDITSLDSLFMGVDKMVNIEFFQNFNTRNIYFMQKMFYNCYSLNWVNVSIFNTENLEDMNNMFYNCSSLKEIDLSNFASNNLKNVNNLFEGCSSLSSIDISGLDLQSISDANSVFEGLPSSGKIKINNNLNEEIKNQIPENWDIKVE